MKRLAALLIFMLAVHHAACLEEGGAGGPHLIISSVEGKLESGRTGSIFIEIENDGRTLIFDQAPAALEEWLRTEGSRALDIWAELRSRDERIEVVSAAQPAGSLERCANRSVEFTARASEGAGPGIYPMEIVLSYRRLSNVDSVGDPHPDIYFQYDDVSETAPLEVKVARGPRLSLESKGDLTPGGEVELEVVVSNRGDEPASKVQVVPSCQPPLICRAEEIELEDLNPGDSASARLKLSAESEAASGYYATPCQVVYQDGKTARTEKTAAMVKVSSKSWIMQALLPFLVLIVAAAGIYFGAVKYRNKRERRR